MLPEAVQREIEEVAAAFGATPVGTEALGSRIGLRIGDSYEVFDLSSTYWRLLVQLVRKTGPALLADTGDWGTYAWTEHVLGAPGYRIAGGSDEIQRNIIGERVLGLAPEPRVDKDVPFAEAQRARF